MDRTRIQCKMALMENLWKIVNRMEAALSGGNASYIERRDSALTICSSVHRPLPT